MQFININSTEMTNVVVVKDAMTDIFGMKRAYNAASYDDSVFDRVVKGLDEELKELSKSVVIETDSSSLKFGCKRTTEFLDIDFVGTEHGDIHIIVEYNYYGGSVLTVKINGKEVKDFNWKVGYSIIQIVAGYLVGLPMVGVYTKL
nr:MAG TPA: hypothetical protein [Caudoviricetes sp.]